MLRWDLLAAIAGSVTNALDAKIKAVRRGRLSWKPTFTSKVDLSGSIVKHRCVELYESLTLAYTGNVDLTGISRFGENLSSKGIPTERPPKGRPSKHQATA
jgi:hypothetical protein